MNVPPAPHQLLRHLLPGILMALGGLLMSAPVAAEQTPRTNCSFDDQPIPCRDSHSSDGSCGSSGGTDSP